jgi:hypothetical protein
MGREEIAAGDIHVIARGGPKQELPPAVLARFTLLRTIEPRRRLPVRTMLDLRGFYAQLPWDVPYAGTQRPELDHFDVLIAR